MPEHCQRRQHNDKGQDDEFCFSDTHSKTVLHNRLRMYDCDISIIRKKRERRWLYVKNRHSFCSPKLHKYSNP